MHRLILYHKLYQSSRLIPNYIKQMIPNTREQDTNRKLRNATTHSHERPHTTLYQRSFFIATNKQYNKLPNDVRSLPISRFKKICRKTPRITTASRFLCVRLKSRQHCSCSIKKRYVPLKLTPAQETKSEVPDLSLWPQYRECTTLCS